MLQVLALIRIVLGFEIVPPWGRPPTIREGAVICYNPLTDSLILHSGQEGTLIYGDTWSFDISANVWTNFEPRTAEHAPESSYGLGWIYDNAFYIYGGITSIGLNSELWSLNLSSVTWTKAYMKNLPQASAYPASIRYEFSGRQYFAVFGGITLTGMPNTLSVLDLAKNEWTTENVTKNSPPAKYSSFLVKHKDCLYLWGGEGTDNFDNHLYQYNLSQARWSNVTVSNLPNDRVFFGAFVHQDFLYVLPGYSYRLYEEETGSFRLNLSDFIQGFTEVKISSTSKNFPKIRYSTIAVNAIVYMFGGSFNGVFLNDIQAAPISSSLEFINLTESYISITPRIYHSANLVSTQIVVFGGYSYSGVLLADTWTFDLINHEWKFIDTNATVSRMRHASCSIGDSVIIFGGEGAEGFLNDFMIYNYAAMAWTTLDVDVSKISRRASACMASHYPYIFLFGGFTGIYSNELWVLDYRTRVITKMDPINSIKPLAGCKCFVRYKEKDLLFYVGLGITTFEVINEGLYSYSLVKNMWTQVGNHSAGRIDGGLVNNLNKLAVFAGTDGFFPKNDLVVIDLDTGEEFTEHFNVSISAFDSVFFADKIFIALGSKVSELTGLKTEAQSNVVIQAQKLLGCSQGTYAFENTCAVCAKGSYFNVQTSRCTLCPAGTYGVLPGASSILQCVKCPIGTFNPISGSNKCLTCPSNKNCSIGASSPDAAYTSDFYYISPPTYKPDPIPPAMDDITYSLYSILAFTIIVCVLLYRTKLLRKLDMFSSEHNYDTGQPLIIKETNVGAFFSLIFYLLCIRLVLNQITLYRYQNVNETKRLLPLVAMENDFNDYKANIDTEVFFYGYEGLCADSTLACSQNISVTMRNIQSESSGYYCKYFNSTCYIKHTCLTCNISSSASLSLILNEELSYATSIRVTISTTSSIPDSPSIISDRFYPSDTFSVFRGFNASVVSATMIPSLFRDQEGQTRQMSGYHASSINMSYEGSTSGLNYFSLDGSLRLVILLYRSEHMLLTQRTLTMNTFEFITAIVGSIFGLLGTLMFFMKVCERGKGLLEARFIDNIKEKSLIHRAGELKYIRYHKELDNS